MLCPWPLILKREFSNSALTSRNPVVVVTVLEEMMHRGGLSIALSGRDEAALLATEMYDHRTNTGVEPAAFDEHEFVNVASSAAHAQQRATLAASRQAQFGGVSGLSAGSG